MMKEKSRTLLQNVGAAGDLLYSLQENVSFYKDKSVFEDPDYWSNKYNTRMAERSDAKIGSPYEGAEYFQWVSLGHDRYNPCLHTKNQNVNLPFLYCTGYPTYYTNQLGADYKRFDSRNPYVLPIKAHSGQLTQFAQARAWHNMQPRFEGKIDLLNFLFELKDFRDVVEVIGKNRTTIARMRKMFTKEKKRFSQMDPTRGIAAGVLAKNLIYDPMVRDCMDIFTQLTVIVREAQEKFKKDGEDFQKSHYSEILFRDESLLAGTKNNYWYSTGYVHQTKFTATLRYKYDYQMRNATDAVIKYWGLDGSFETVWNCMPLTFVYDYFIQIGKSLHAMEHDPAVKLLEFEYGESLLTTYKSGLLTNGHPQSIVFIINGHPYLRGRGDTMKDHLITGGMGSMFTRRPTTPYWGPALPRLHKPGSKQVANMLALARCFI